MIGSLLLVVAGLAAAASVPVAAFSRSDRDRRRGLDRALLVAAVGSLWASVAFLAAAIMRLDTSYAYVAEQTRPGMSLPLRLSTLWAGAEGSLLLFGAMTGTALVVGHGRAPRWQRAGVGLVTAGLAATSWQAANPFVRLDLPPLTGVGMAPILEHYAMIIHPPLLYVGLCLALTPALVRDHGQAHRLGLAALGVLTVALGLGSAWAYVELGWGGWWAWDPIENLALIVWLLLAAALHWRPRQSETMRRGQDQADLAGVGSGSLGAVPLWALCWPAVLGGAAMTRTSLRTSVHAFADAAGLATWLWPLVVLSAIGVVLRVGETGGVASPRWWTRSELAVRWPQIILATAGFVIAAGTYRPFVPGDGTAGFFYSRTLFPIVIAGAVLLAVVPLWRPGRDWPTTISDAAKPGLWSAAALTLLVTLAGWRTWYQLVLAVVIGFAAGPVILSGRQNLARMAGHLGILLILFAALAGTVSTESSVRLQVGQTVTLDGHRVQLVTVDVVSDEPLRAAAIVLIDDSDRLEPSVTFYPERALRLPEVATGSTPWRDTQVILRDVDAEEGALLTVLFRPWNQLVWWGVACLTVAAVLALARTGARRPKPAEKQTSPG